MLKRKRITLSRIALTALPVLATGVAMAQSNSPYSRFGLGDAVPSTHIINRAMGGVTAGDADFLYINFSNPASYSNFQVGNEARTKKIVSGRVLFDAGINIENRTIREPNNPAKFTSSDLYFNYIQLGVPLRKGWGLSLGLRPLTRVSYKIADRTPINGIRNSFTEYSGTGGSYLPTIGTGFALKNLSLGVNIGYLFGRRESNTSLSLLTDSVLAYNSVHKSETSFGNLFANAGMQYKINLNKKNFIRFGAFGNLQNKLKATQNQTIGTFTEDPTSTVALTDTVYTIKGTKGTIIYPSSFTAGLIVGGSNDKAGLWQVGADVVRTNWDQYRFYGRKDAVQSTTQIRVGGQFRPSLSSNYTSAITYRAGFFAGKDYITAGGDLPSWGLTAGLGLPIANYNRLSPAQFTIVNLAFEYNNRGNNDNPIKENVFRISAGLNFSDLWFNKRKYD